jgi:casein kinase 1 epsilon
MTASTVLTQKVSIEPMMERTVGGRYNIHRRIDAGSFGEVYAGVDVQTNQEVAIKLEPVKTRAPQLPYESKLYLLLAGGVSVPRLHWFGTEAEYHVLVIEQLGRSLEKAFQLCHHRFSLKTVLMISDQTICALEYMHRKCFVHRDVKPDNFMIGGGNKSSQIFVIDFGLSKKYRDSRTLEHMKFAQGKSLTGTARYASVSTHKGSEQSRRDDLESLGYCLIYFLKGSLPWMGLDGKDRKDKCDRIGEMKANTSFEELCEGLPREFVMYFQAVRGLGFADDPNYSLYRQWFRSLFIRMGYVYDGQYDWIGIGPRPRARSNQTHASAPASTVTQTSDRTLERLASMDAEIGPLGLEGVSPISPVRGFIVQPPPLGDSQESMGTPGSGEKIPSFDFDFFGGG